MPRINILKVDRPVCEHCGNKIEDEIHCEIETATGKIIKMHRECAVDFAVSILEAFNEDGNLNKLVEKVVKSHVKNLPHAHLGVCGAGEYVYYDIKDYDSCCRCENFCDNKKEERYECNIEHCYFRDGCEKCDSYQFNLNTQRYDCMESHCKHPKS